jgi:type II secretory pathway pseudopilin PulG
MNALISPHRRTNRPPRRGFVLIAILATFAIMAMLAGVWARAILQQSHQQRLDQERVQARWLAEAGVRRAAALLAANPAYAGDTWQVDALQLSRAEGAAVVITVEPAAAAGQVRIVAQASYPRDNARVRETKTVVFKLPGESQS